MRHGTVLGMTKGRTWEGSMTKRDTPSWTPLLDLVGDELAGDFMWMFEVVLTDGTCLQAFKHIDTRRYLHLRPDGAAFAYEPTGRYRVVDAADVLVEVFAPLPGLAGVTSGQLEASRRAVERLISD